MLWQYFIMCCPLISNPDAGCGAVTSITTQLLTTLWSPGAGTRSGGCSRPGCLSLPRGGGLRQRSPVPAGWYALCLHPAAIWRRSGGQWETLRVRWTLQTLKRCHETFNKTLNLPLVSLRACCRFSVYLGLRRQPLSRIQLVCWYCKLLFIDYNMLRACFSAPLSFFNAGFLI